MKTDKRKSRGTAAAGRGRQTTPQNPPPTAAAVAVPLMDFSFARASRLFPPTLARPHFYIIGNGGNGSYLALHVGRLSYILKERGQEPEITFIDPDVVENKNIGRQNFCPAERGEYKAITLARRFEEAFGIRAAALPEYFDPAMVNESSGRAIILLGCVDNAPARVKIAETLRKLESRYRTDPAMWLDCGNHRHTGQIIIGTATDITNLAGTFPLPEVCTALPAPSMVMPDLLITDRDEATEKQKMSCAERMLLNDQSPAINSMMADFTAAYLFNLFVYGELKAYRTDVNLRHFSASSYYITPEAIERVSGVPVATLTRRIDQRTAAYAA
jgi:PRTRC genetic system ThiF family protein